jgi:hypothetical protein
MAVGATLVQSSPRTQTWLRRLRDGLPQLEYGETKYWAAFRNARRAVAYLNPAQKSARLFLALDPVHNRGLQPTPSTSSWKRLFPSVFEIAGEQDLTEARRLILESQAALATSPGRTVTSRSDYLTPEELLPKVHYEEGSARQVLVNAYERNRRAREKCLQHYGRSCAACGLSSEARYGGAAAGYIQVHHIIPIAQVRTKYRLNAIRDLRPVCPNCHAVIHRREPPFSIEDVRRMLLDVRGNHA